MGLRTTKTSTAPRAVRTRAYERDTLTLALRLEASFRVQGRLLSAEESQQHGLLMPAAVREANDSERDTREAPLAKYSSSASARILETFRDLATQHRGGQSTPVTSHTLCHLHEQLLVGLPSDSELAVGQFRTTEVAIGNQVCPSAAEVPAKVEALLAWARSSNTSPLPKAPIASALIKATTVHAELLAIHPFMDGNGRTARAFEFNMLLAAGVPLSVAHELHNWYNQDRSLYVQALRQAQNGRPDPFVRYALKGLNQRIKQRLHGVVLAKPFGRRQLLRVGLSLTELVVVMLILGILAGVAAPRLFNHASDAEDVAEAELVRRVQESIEHYYFEALANGNPEFPALLDDASSTCNAATPCFVNVLREGVRSGGWFKNNPYEYNAPSGLTYIYNPTTGDFLPG